MMRMSRFLKEASGGEGRVGSGSCGLNGRLARPLQSPGDNRTVIFEKDHLLKFCRLTTKQTWIIYGFSAPPVYSTKDLLRLSKKRYCKKSTSRF